MQILKLITISLTCSFLLFANKGIAKDHDHSKHQNSKERSHEHKDHKDHNHEDQEASVVNSTPDMVLIKVKGMVCAFCAQGIKKNFNAREEVKSTKVDLDKMEVTVHYNKGKSLSKKAIKDIVTGAGFKFVGLE